MAHPLLMHVVWGVMDAKLARSPSEWYSYKQLSPKVHGKRLQGLRGSQQMITKIEDIPPQWEEPPIETTAL